jgi:hypothetical protein
VTTELIEIVQYLSSLTFGAFFFDSRNGIKLVVNEIRVLISIAQGIRNSLETFLDAAILSIDHGLIIA